MSPVKNQPVLPAEVPYTDAEVDFIDSSPPGLFAENQNSNVGFIIRKVFTDRVQELIAEQDRIYNNRFIDSAGAYLEDWEIQEGVPANPNNASVASRRSVIFGRIRKGPFTRAARKNIVERYIRATFGTSISFGTLGATITSSGLSLYSETVVDVSTLYKITENIPGFSYHIYILNTIVVSDGMSRELDRITPAGITYSISYVATLP